MPVLNFPALTPVQENVLAAITGGATMKAAAATASIHRNTISYWRQTSAAFRDALGHAQYDKALFIREEAEDRVTKAFAAIDTILENPQASASARLNAARFIIEKASTPPPPEPGPVCQVQAAPANIVPSRAQSPTPDPIAPAPTEPPKPEIVHSRAQSRPIQPLRSAPKAGRNEPCPCGSHLKFKRCCIGKPPLAAAA